MDLKYLYDLDSQANKLQDSLTRYIEGKFLSNNIARRHHINNFPCISTIMDNTTDLIFVKWIKASGESISDSKFRYDAKSDIISVDNFDSSDKSCSSGIHLLSLDCALGYIFQEGLVSKLNELALLVCLIPLGNMVIRHSFRLYSKVRTRSIKRLNIIPFKDNFESLPTFDTSKVILKRSDIMTKHGMSNVELKNIDTHPEIIAYFTSNENHAWQLAYWLSDCKNARQVVKRKQSIMQLISDEVEISKRVDKLNKELEGIIVGEAHRKVLNLTM
jgi:hypothetical protein